MVRQLLSPMFLAPTLSAIALATLLGTTGLVREAIASPASMTQPSATQSKQQTDSLSRPVAMRIRRAAATELGLPPGQLRIASQSRQSWSDSCLGLGGPAELCAAMITEGWRVELSNGSQSWFFRADRSGQVVRMERSPETGTLPGELRRRVLAAAAQESQQPIGQLDVLAASEQTWDGCFGIYAGPNTVCTMMATFGWRVVVTDGQRNWVYHTNQDGSELRLNAIASSAAAIPSLLYPASVGDDPGEGVVFRAIASGGIAGQTTETMLLADGRILRLTLPAASMPTVIGRVSPEQMQRFEQLLQTQRFANFNQLAYQTDLADDYFSVTLSGYGITTQYADVIFNDLPSELQAVIQAWNQLSSRTSSAR